MMLERMDVMWRRSLQVSDPEEEQNYMYVCSLWLITERERESAILCKTIVHNDMHTDMSSSYKWILLGLGF